MFYVAVTYVVPLYDIICLHALSFIKQCLSSDSDGVRLSYGQQSGFPRILESFSPKFKALKVLENRTGA